MLGRSKRGWRLAVPCAVYMCAGPVHGSRVWCATAVLISFPLLPCRLSALIKDKAGDLPVQIFDDFAKKVSVLHLPVQH
jgi:hypothetical protein